MTKKKTAGTSARKSRPARAAAQGTRPVETTFVCDVDPDASEVYLAGDFSDWDPRGFPMTKQGGSFRTRVTLSPGEYQYKFIVDGAWHADPAASTQVPNQFGSMNSVVRVPRPASKNVRRTR